MKRKKLKPIPSEEVEVKQVKAPKIGVTCKIHGQRPGVTFRLDGTEFGRFCFECYAKTLTALLRDNGLEDFRTTAIDL